MTVLWTDKSLAQAAEMYESAMPTKAEKALDAMVAQSVRLELLIQRVQAEAAIVAEACRLTDEWANGFYLGRGTEPTPGDYARVGIGYYLEIKGVGGYSTPGVVVGKCGLCGGLLAEDKGVTACDSCGREVTR